MAMADKKAAIEGILFTMGDAVEGERIAEALSLTEDEFQQQIDELIQEYENPSRGMMILRLGTKYQMCTKTECYEDLIKLCHVPKKHVLTDVMLETLAIVAYKQPVTRADIDAIRGVNSDFTINKLLEYHLICELGRLEAPGRPIVFGTTDDFLRSFGVSSIDELPYIGPEMVEEFKQEAEEEATIGV